MPPIRPQFAAISGNSTPVFDRLLRIEAFQRQFVDFLYEAMLFLIGSTKPSVRNLSQAAQPPQF